MIYSHDWEVVHDQVKGFIQATGLKVEQKVFKFWKIRIITDVRLWTGGEYTRNLRLRLDADKKQEETFNLNNKN